MCVPFEFNMYLSSTWIAINSQHSRGHKHTRPPKSYVLELHESNCKSTNIIFFEIGNGQILLLPYHIVKVDRVRDRDTDSSTHTAFLDPTCSTSLGWTCCRTQDCL